MKSNPVFLAVLFAMLFCMPWGGAPALAQESQPGEGINSGNYNIKQSFEFGYRFTDFTGNKNVYRTFVNYSDGPRLLQHTLEMRALDHKGWLFDDFFLTSFGYGGDPNAVSRLRIYKNKWYNFNANFRTDRNRWDYVLLANPLNPTNSVPFIPITESPHRFSTVRRMGDYSLTILPQSRLRFRLGFTRNIHEGPSYTTPRAGTETLGFQGWKTTLNSYSIGADFKFLPRTNISYDQFLHYYKGDTTWTLAQLPYRLTNGTPVDLGNAWNTLAGQPCASNILFRNFNASPPIAHESCNGFLDYDLAGRVRTSYPTEQLSFQSNYFKNVDLSGRFVYSASDMEIPDYNEFFDGRLSRTNVRQYVATGTNEGRRVAATLDFGATFHITDKFRIVDSFRFHNFRVPGAFNLNQLNFFGATMLVTPNIFPTANPAHNTSSPADVQIIRYSDFLGQDSKFNQLEFLYDFSRKVGIRAGWRVRSRDITLRSTTESDQLYFPTLPNRGDPVTANRSLLVCAGQPLAPDGSCRRITTSASSEEHSITEHSVLFGFWGRPHNQFRFSFDMEILNADEAFTRISPRDMQRYKLRASYKPTDWATFSFAMNLLEAKNDVPEILHRQHARSYSFSGALMPNDNFSLDFGYDFNDVFSRTNICFRLDVVTLPPGTTPCPQSTTSAPLQAISFYNHDTHTGHLALRWKPVARLTTHLGYNITSTTGSTLILSPTAPPGPLRYNYYQPELGFECDLGKGLAWKGNWNFYGYQETGIQDSTVGRRNFRGNLVTLAVRYNF